MYVNAMPSSDWNVDQPTNFVEIDYTYMIGGCALILTITILAAYFPCCWNRAHEVNQNTSTVGVEENSGVFTKTEVPSDIISPTNGIRSKDMTALTKPKGLFNIGNTCYFNSVMQALTHTPILQTQLDTISGRGDMIRALAEFYAFMHCSETSAFDPRRLHKQLVSRTGKFQIGRQHDSHECLLCILEELRKDERNGRKQQLTVVDKIFGGHFMTVYKCKSCDTPVHLCEPFIDISLPICSSNARKSRKGSTATDTPSSSLASVDYGNQRRTTETGNALAITQEPQTDRDINIGKKNVAHSELKRKKEPDDSSRERLLASKIAKRGPCEDFPTFTKPEVISAEQEAILDQKEAYKLAVHHMMSTLSTGETPDKTATIDGCFRRYTRLEHLNGDYLCKECKPQKQGHDDAPMTSATKQTLIFSPPAVLTLHLKRFENKSGKYVKRNTMVRYDELLDIGPYCSAWCRRNNPPSRNIWYALYAVVVHSGSLQCGHYIAYVKRRIASEKRREYDQKFEQLLQRKYLNRDEITAESLILEMNNLNDDELKCIECPTKNEGIWYCMNDDAVRRVSVQDALNQEAFLLFYERLHY